MSDLTPELMEEFKEVTRTRNQKRITITLTEDQWREVCNLLMQRQTDDTDESMAFRWRIVKAIKNTLA